MIDIILNVFKNEAGTPNILGKIVIVVISLLGAKILTEIISKIISKRVYSGTIEKKDKSNRILTVMQLLQKIINIFIYFIAITIALQTIGVKTNSLVATLGVGSLAISFGAQNLVKDVINGMFIILEDHYAVGDLVKISDFQGYVEDVGIRSTQLRDFNGTLHVIPNGEIKFITNQARGTMRSLVEISVDLREDPDKVINIFEEALKVFENDERVLKGPNIWGVTGNNERSYNITVVIYSELKDKYNLEYELRKTLIKAINANNIRLPEIRGKIEEDYNA